jgi:hypothetical protein
VVTYFLLFEIQDKKNYAVGKFQNFQQILLYQSEIINYCYLYLLFYHATINYFIIVTKESRPDY